MASSILACALFKDGKYALAFPSFGVERRGAPVEAYVRFDEGKVFLRSGVYTPDHVVVLAVSLLDVVDMAKGLKPGGVVLLNTDRAPESFPAFAPFRAAAVDANRIAVRHRLGNPAQPIVNTAILGAFARATGLVTLEAVCEAIREEAPVKKEENAAAAREAWESVRFAPEASPPEAAR